MQFDKFWHGCIPARLALATGIVFTKDEHLKYWLIPAVPAVLFIMYKYFTHKGDETGFFNKYRPLWWNGLRPFHALVLALFILFIVLKQFAAAKAMMFVSVAGGVAFKLYSRK